MCTLPDSDEEQSSTREHVPMTAAGDTTNEGVSPPQQSIGSSNQAYQSSASVSNQLSSLVAEASSHPQDVQFSQSLDRSNLNVDEFLLEAKAEQNLLIGVWSVHFNQTTFSNHMDELDFNSATLAGKLSAGALCSLATNVVQRMGKEKGVKTIESLTFPCVSLSLMQIASQKIAGVVSPSLHIKEFVIPFTAGEIPNDRVQTFSITTVAENLSTCHPLCLRFVATDQSTPPSDEMALKEKLVRSMRRRRWNPKITYRFHPTEGSSSHTVLTLTDPPYSSPL